MLCISACFPGCCSAGRSHSPAPEGRQRSISRERGLTGIGPAYDVWRSAMTSTVSPSINMQTRGPAEPPADAQGGAAGQSRENNHGLTLDVEEIASRRLYSAGAGLDYTPRGPEAAAYKYYCPLCMNYFKGIFESRCCRHYICYECLLAYVAGKYGVTPEDLPFLEVPFLFPLPCPHCSSLAFEPGPVSPLPWCGATRMRQTCPPPSPAPAWAPL